MLKKRTALILALLFVILLITACAGSDTTGNDSVITAVETENKVPDMSGERALVSDNLPEKDYDGRVINILIRTESVPYFYSEHEDADIVNDALYKRDLTVKERYSVGINYIVQDGSWDDQTNFISFVRASITSGDNSFDVGEGYAAYITALVGENLFCNWHDMEYINLDQPWWSQQCAEEMTINDKLFFVTGDYSLYMWNCVFTMIFNKQLMADYNIGNLYDTVNQGSWTLDYLREISKKFYSDTDSDGKYSNGDIYGTGIPISNNIDAIQVMFDCPITVKDSDGIPVLNLDDERFSTVMTGVYDFLFNTEGVFAGAETSTIGQELLDMFKSNQTFITTQSFSAIGLLRTMEVDFGIIPYPKLNESQSSYISVAGDSFSLFFLPSTIQDTEFTSIIVETLFAESYKQVIPAYYDIALKTKYSRDEESKQMIDLIRDSLTFNFGAINSTMLADIGPAQLLRVALKNRSTDFASRWQSIKKQSESNLENLIKAYE